MIVDGKAIAADILRAVRTDLPRTLSVRAITADPSLATLSYLSTKTARASEAGMTLEVVRLPAYATTDDALAAIDAPGADAIIVQLPLPEQFDTQKIVNHIPLEKDADVLSDTAYERFNKGETGALMPPVAGAVAEILERTHVDPSGKRAVVVGQGKLVGRPVGALLERLGADTVVILRDTPNPGDILREADIIVSGAGQAGLITKDMLKAGVVLIDAGTSESNGSVAGDAEPSCAEVASVFTPVPGGVGPVAVACLFKNVSQLARS